jgi:HK97 family phage major capsid protein
MSFKLKGLREQRGAVKAKIVELGDRLRKEGRSWNAEERAEFARLEADHTKLSEEIRAAEADVAAAEAIAARDNDEREDRTNPKPGREDRNGDPRKGSADVAERTGDIRLARQAWARKQYGLKLTREHVAACKRVGIDPRQRELVIRLGDPAKRAERYQKRALTVTTSAGGYLIAEDYSFELEQKLVDFSAVRGVCREVPTENGADLPWPTEDDTSNTGELLAINTEVAYADPTFGSVTFGAYKFSSKGIIVPNELMQDAAFDVDQMVFGECGTRIGRAQSTYFTTGTGASQPKGIVTCASAGVTTAVAAAFTADELTKLAHSVDPAYRSDPSCGYMMKDDVLAYALMLKDSAGRPLLRESYAQGAGTMGNRSNLTLNGFPVYVNQAMTGLTSSVPVTATKHVLFGAFAKFIVRDAGAIRLRRLDERWAEKDQVGFIGFLRSDSNCVNTSAIKYLLQA